MRRGKFIYRPFATGEAQPFASTEEAWLWYAQCQMARDEGVRFTAGQGDVMRPCDPDDIARALAGLVRGRVLARGHVLVLGRFGRRQSPPDPWAGDPPQAAALWQEALDRLDRVLRPKGIVS